MRDAQTAAPAPGVQPIQYDDAQPPPPQDPIAADRKRRDYESLFASNVVLSRRPENERPDIGRAFIEAASGALRAGGRLLLVANRQLPYEAAIAHGFASARTLAEREGYKVIEAIR